MDRHVKTLVREILPIFIAISLLVGLALFVFWPQGGIKIAQKSTLEKFEQNRIGLLLAKEGSLFDPRYALISAQEMARAPLATRFDYPMGSEHGSFSYNAQPFLTDRHLGDDLNGIGGWNSDLGDPVYAVADGEVIFAGWPSDGWGNVVTVLHRLPEGKSIETFYGHLDTIDLPVGYQIRRGERLGTVGNANGTYLAHLHFEIREHGTFDAGAGYSDTALGRLSGEPFLQENRNASPTLLNAAVAPTPSDEGNSSLEVELPFPANP